jgi:hypothetical protein
MPTLTHLRPLMLAAGSLTIALLIAIPGANADPKAKGNAGKAGAGSASNAGNASNASSASNAGNASNARRTGSTGPFNPGKPKGGGTGNAR